MILTIWLLMGFVWVWMRDRSEMRKPVPYPEMPSGIGLGKIRMLMFAFGSTVGAPMLVIGPILSAWLMIERIRLCRMIRALRRKDVVLYRAVRRTLLSRCPTRRDR